MAPITIDGVNVLSDPIFAPDCAFPIVNWQTCCTMDDVLRNLRLHLGHWGTNIAAPALVGTTFEIQTPTPNADNCVANFAVVTQKTGSCQLTVPNMVIAGLRTPNINLLDVVDEFCRRRNILTKQWCVFNADGTINYGSPIAIDFDRYLMSVVYTALVSEIMRVAITGDSANTSVVFKPTEPDGLYTQLLAGWDQSLTNPCPDQWNKATEIDWNDMTGGAVGACATPDKLTVGGKTITVGGVTYPIPVGINYAQFLEQLWIDRIAHDASCVGGVDSWEMHLPTGQWQCIVNSASCMGACASCANATANDPTMRERYASNYASRMVELYPSGRSFPLWESKNLTNEMWFGPRDVGGRPTYGVYFDDMSRYFSGAFRTGTFAGLDGYGYTDQYDPIGLIPSDLLASNEAGNLEDRAIYWTLKRDGDFCLHGSMMARFGILVCERHLWLHVKNICCSTLIEPCPNPIVVLP